MAKNLEIAYLLDFYGDMLTEKQRNAIDLYYNDDLSLAEIAQAADISRQGVRDNIKRAEQILTELEEKLGLAKRFSDMKQGFAEIIRAADSIEKISENLPQEYKANIKNYTKIIKAASERLSGELKDGDAFWRSRDYLISWAQLLKSLKIKVS